MRVLLGVVAALLTRNSYEFIPCYARAGLNKQEQDRKTAGMPARKAAVLAPVQTVLRGSL